MKVNGVDIPAEQRSAQHKASQLDCGSFYLTLHEYDPGWEDTSHSHPHAQFGYILKGDMKVWVENDVIEQAEGEGVFISGGVEHRSAAPSQKTVTLNLYIKPEGQ